VEESFIFDSDYFLHRREKKYRRTIESVFYLFLIVETFGPLNEQNIVDLLLQSIKLNFKKCVYLQAVENRAFVSPQWLFFLSGVEVVQES
jgi:hypothetical protein